MNRFVKSPGIFNHMYWSRENVPSDCGTESLTRRISLSVSICRTSLGAQTDLFKSSCPSTQGVTGEFLGGNRTLGWINIKRFVQTVTLIDDSVPNA